MYKEVKIVSPIPASQHFPISEKVEAYQADDMRMFWVSDLQRNWGIYSKKEMEVSFWVWVSIILDLLMENQ